MPMGINISPSIWQPYINAILDCLQSRTYREAIMNDLLLFMPPKKSHIAKLEDLLKALLKMDSTYHQRYANSLEKNYNIWEILYLLGIGRVCIKLLQSGLEAIQKLKPQ